MPHPTYSQGDLDAFPALLLSSNDPPAGRRPRTPPMQGPGGPPIRL